ncbi:PREDICTED: protein FIZZY-RELATED 2-like [Camelina sativa]|uniref:Protein FIZZY-RELATED 2-like n=1 Tax=Camelina sativa TaxID=90675 RepID=A0ABM0V5U4_CAMSA|nr:PREDICTED: protein FIZZY-RELATED 2-like [Camelina sativa]
MMVDEDPSASNVITNTNSSSSSSSSSPSMNNTTPVVSLERRINRLINANQSQSPSRSIYSDRFIPSRSGSNFALFDLSPSPSKDGKEDGAGSYATLLRAAMFGPETPEKRDITGFSSSRNIFRFKTETKTHRSFNSFSPFGVDDPPGGVSHSPVKAPRKVPRSPYKVLDAPALQDDFYLNLVDWSAQNVLAVGLGNCVYLWNACSSKVTKLCDLGADDSVCSVGWALRGTHLAVGTSTGKVQIWDASRCKRTRTMEGHRLRVGALAWGSSVLSSGSRDKSILQRDIRCQEDHVSKLAGHKSEVCGLKWSYDNKELASGGNDNRVCNLAWSKNVNELVSTHGYSQNQIIVWKYPTMSKIATLTGHTYRVLYLAVSPDGQTIVTGAGDETLRFWNVFPSPKSQNTDSEIGSSFFGRTTIR